ncbi:MAG: hypothetical protein FH758_00395 [Firmicutes bacterium]|nr:hypothetical protein [Bacillota bacterium]
MEQKKIFAAVTVTEGAIKGGVPIFYAKDDEQKAKIASTLANINDGMVHELDNGVMIIVQH